jgi:hypothetical protein
MAMHCSEGATVSLSWHCEAAVGRRGGISVSAMRFLAVLIFALAFPCRAEVHSNKHLRQVFPGDLTHPCIFFTLEAVTQADPVLPGSPWFVLSPTHPRFQETYALILAAWVSGEPVNVGTTGAGVGTCGGYAEVNYVETAT